MTDNIKVGDRVRFTPDSDTRRAWTVTARNADHIVAVRQAYFEPEGVVQYTVTEVRDYRYNGVRPGLVRSSLNTMGGGWDLDHRIDEGSREIIAALEAGEYELSNRRVIEVDDVTVVT